MARSEAMDQRLRMWAQWLTVGDGSGYPAKSPLHPEWSPPSAGMTPTMKTAAPSSARQTHRAVATLSARLQHTLLVHYLGNLPVAEQALRLECQPCTVHSRVEQAHALLLRALQQPEQA